MSEKIKCALGYDGVPPRHVTNCPNIKDAGGGFEGERYRCKVCGFSIFLDYEDMR